jgi:hypothetical protein
MSIDGLRSQLNEEVSKRNELEKALAVLRVQYEACQRGRSEAEAQCARLPALETDNRDLTLRAAFEHAQSVAAAEALDKEGDRRQAVELQMQTLRTQNAQQARDWAVARGEMAVEIHQREANIRTQQALNQHVEQLLSDARERHLLQLDQSTRTATELIDHQNREALRTAISCYKQNHEAAQHRMEMLHAAVEQRGRQVTNQITNNRLTTERFMELAHYSLARYATAVQLIGRLETQPEEVEVGKEAFCWLHETMTVMSSNGRFGWASAPQEATDESKTVYQDVFQMWIRVAARTRTYCRWLSETGVSVEEQTTLLFIMESTKSNVEDDEEPLRIQGPEPRLLLTGVSQPQQQLMGN